MKSTIRIILLEAVSALMLLAMFLLPVLYCPDQDLFRNNATEPCSGSAVGSWIINPLFMAFGIMSVISGWRVYEGFALHRMVLLLFGASCSATAFLNMAKLNTSVVQIVPGAALSACLFGIVIMSFAVLAVSTSFINSENRDKTLSAGAGIATVITAVLREEYDGLAGLWQGVMFIMISGWMIYSFKRSDI